MISFFSLKSSLVSESANECFYYLLVKTKDYEFKFYSCLTTLEIIYMTCNFKIMLS